MLTYKQDKFIENSDFSKNQKLTDDLTLNIDGRLEIQKLKNDF